MTSISGTFCATFNSSLIVLVAGLTVLCYSLRVLAISLSSFDRCIHRIHSIGGYIRLYHGLGNYGIRNIWTSQAAYLETFGFILVLNDVQYVWVHVSPVIPLIWSVGFMEESSPAFVSSFEVLVGIVPWLSIMGVWCFKYASLVVVPSSYRRYFWTFLLISFVVVDISPRYILDNVPGRRLSHPQT